jgi:hypothetical protein
MKGLSNILEETDTSEVGELQRGKLYYETYGSSIKIICENVLSGNDTLLY